MKLLPEARRAALDALKRLRLLLKSLVSERLDAVDMLMANHLRVRLLFFQALAARNPARKAKVNERIRSELESHSRLGDTLFYPECEKVDALRPLALKLREELRLMMKEEPSFDDWNRHMDEAENELFPRVREHLGQERLLSLGARIESARNRLRGAA